MKTFSFDVKMLASFHVQAETLAQARAILRDSLDCADANFGAWPNGDPILAEASIDGEPDLYEIDGKYTG